MTSTATLVADAHLADALHWIALADDAAADGNARQAAVYQLLVDASLALAGL